MRNPYGPPPMFGLPQQGFGMPFGGMPGDPFAHGQRLMPKVDFKGPQGAQPQPPPMAPMMAPPPDNSMAPLGMGLGAAAMGLGKMSRDMPYPHWAPTNDAANMLQSGAYPDPLLRKAATWDVPGLDFFSRFGSLFK